MTMNDAMATGLRAAGCVARIGQAAMWVALAGLLAVLVVGATVETVDAKGQSSQNIFVRGCKDLGGKPKRIETHVVECRFPKKDDGSGGGVVTCDFNKKPFQCKFLAPHAGATDVPFGEIEDMISTGGEPGSNPSRPSVPPVDGIATTKQSR